MPFMRLKPEYQKFLKLEVIPHEPGLKFTRFIRAACATNDDDSMILRRLGSRIRCLVGGAQSLFCRLSGHHVTIS